MIFCSERCAYFLTTGVTGGVESSLGRDSEGEWLSGELDRLGIGREGLLSPSGRPTTVKSRIVAHHQQVVRFDHERKTPPSAAVIDRLRGFLRKAWGEADGVVVSDYAEHAHRGIQVR